MVETFSVSPCHLGGYSTLYISRVILIPWVSCLSFSRCSCGRVVDLLPWQCGSQRLPLSLFSLLPAPAPPALFFVSCLVLAPSLFKASLRECWFTEPGGFFPLGPVMMAFACTWAGGAVARSPHPIAGTAGRAYHRPVRRAAAARARALPVQMVSGVPGGGALDVTPTGAGGGDSGPVEPASNHEVLLAELAFSDPDKLPGIIERNVDSLDETFYNFLEAKINESSDLEERETLRCLRDAVTDIMGKILNAASSAENPELAEQLAAEVAVLSYDALLAEIQGAASAHGGSLASAVRRAYNRVDMRFLQHLAQKNLDAASDEERAGIEAVQAAVTQEMTVRMSAASAAFKSVVTAGDEDAMNRQMALLLQKGELDEAFLLLLAGNLEQAKAAGVEQAVAVLTRLQARAAELKDNRASPEVALVRKLLRTPELEERRALLTAALTPRKKIALADGSSSSGVVVDGKKLVTALRRLVEEFGNVDAAIIERVDALGLEAEAVAREIYGLEGKDIGQLQDEAFHKRSVSVWDLEQVEIQSELEGREAPWAAGNKLPGFDEEGRMQL